MRNLRASFLIAVPIAGLFLAFPAAGAGGRNIQVTRDPANTPLTTYSEYLARIGPPPAFQITEVARTGERATGTILIIVETSLYASVSAAVSTYSTDLAAAGYSVTTYSSSGGTAASLRSYIQSQSSGLVGVLLVGDLPVPWFEIGYEFDGPDEDTLDDEYTNFPCDLFYMDLDGTWQDLNSTDPFQTGVYDSHTNGSGDTAPEIWVGRLTSSTMTLGGATEAGLINNFLAKDHNFRQGSLTPVERMLLYVDDDWVDTAQYCDSSGALAYAARVLVQDKATTCRNDYREVRLSASYEFMQVMLHATPALHYFKVNDQWEMDGGNYATVTNSDIQSRNPEAIFYNLYTCSSCRYVETDYIGGWYIFVPTNGLGAIGTTKVGGMWDYASCYEALGAGKSFGDAFRDWFAAQAPYDQGAVRWFYGMTLLGDGALALRPHVSSGEPGRHELVAAQNTPVTLTFDRPMKSSTLDASSVLISGKQSGRHAGSYVYDANLRRLRFTGSTEFLDGEDVIVNLSRRAHSADDIPSAVDFREFTVAIGNPTPGTFAAGGSIAVPEIIMVYAADWNGDGWPDLAGGRGYAVPDSLSILLNDGAGGFLPRSTYPVGPQVNGFVSGDFDGDGDLDLAVSSASTAYPIGVYVNQGSGTFTGPTYYAVYSGAGGKILAGDWEGDGDVDLATLSGWPSKYVNIFSNNGSGVFTLSYFPIGSTVSFQFLHAAADADNDGDLDLLGLGRGGGLSWYDSLSVYSNDGRGRFTRSHPGGVPYNPNGLAVSDFDGDGDVDFVVTSDGDATTSVKFLRNAGDGTISEYVNLDQTGLEQAITPVSGDWDGDGDIDLAYIYIDYRGYGVRVRVNNGGGVFSSPTDYAIASPNGVTAADFDRDHDLDLVVANYGLYRLNNGTGADATAPSRVHDLAGSATARSATGSIRWTAPGDDGGLGRATLYDLRYSATPVGADSAAWWTAARLATTEPIPSLAGLADSCDIAGLSADSTYYLILRTRDEASNWSGYSNVLALAPASAAVDDPAVAAVGFRLEAIAPNPCHAPIWIRFGLGGTVAGTAHLRLTLFDVQGRRIRGLVDRTDASAGPYSVLWDLRNDAGSPVPSGLYFCRLEAGALRRTERILCIR